jgi:hypothetical protein
MEEANIPIANNALPKKKGQQPKGKKENGDLNLIGSEEQPQTAKAFFPCKFSTVKPELKSLGDLKYYAEHVDGCSICKI